MYRKAKSFLYFTKSLYLYSTEELQDWVNLCRDEFGTMFRISFGTSVTGLGDFWKVLVTNFLYKVAQIYDDFLGQSEKIILM